MATGTISKKTVGDVLLKLDSEESSFKRYMELNLKKIVPAMIEKRIIGKKLGKLCLKGNDLDLLVANMKEMTLENFLGYLEILTEFGSNERFDGETRKLMRLMKGLLEAMKPEPNSRHAAVTKQLIAIAFSDQSPSESCTSIDLDKEQAQLEGSSPLIPAPLPPGQFRDAVSHSFTSEGGVLYSPVHGVTVTIPPNAIPGGVKFDICMYFYLGQPFTTEEGMDLCSVVVWFHHQPFFEFLEDVTVEIPHAASADPTSLRVLTWGEDKQGPPYKLDTEVPADFSDGYHTMFKVKHFSPYSVVSLKVEASPAMKKKRNKRLDKFKKETSGSLEHSLKDSCAISHSLVNPDHGGSDIPGGDGTVPPTVQKPRVRYSIACYMPKDRSGVEWEVTFAACYNHPSGNWVLQLVKKCGEELYGSGCAVRRTSFHTCDEYLELHPQTWTDSSWNVFALEANVLSIQDIEDIPRSSPKQEFEELISAKLYPPSVTYSVQRSGPPPNTALRCRIDVTHAQATNGKPPFFELTSSPLHLQFKPQTEQILGIYSYLYGDRSDVVKALANPADDITLNTDTSDHVKFLAEISFQLSNSNILSHALELPELTFDQIIMECQHIGDVCFYSYKLLTEWVIRKGRDAKLSSLRNALCKMGIKTIQVCSEDVDHVLIRPAFNKCSFPNICSSEYVSTVNEEVKFVYKLSQMLHCCWRRVGSLMGIPLVRLDEIDVAAASDTSSTPGYNMLLEWQKRNGREATLGTLFRALKCAFCYSPSHTNHAYWYAAEKAEKWRLLNE